jgi:hypothetical protein
MKITIESTSQIVTVGGVKTRRWLGVTDRGTKCDVFVSMLRAANTEDSSQFDEEMLSMPQPEERAIDLRYLI